jgi:hypothetical protein
MILICQLHPASQTFIDARTPADCAPGAIRHWGPGEANWDGTKWNALAPWEFVTLNVDPMTADFQVEIATSWGTLVMNAAQLHSGLVTG